MAYGFNDDRSRHELGGLGTELQATDDLNTLTTAGQRYYWAGGDASPANAPELSDVGVPFTLEVVESPAEGYIEQIVHEMAMSYGRSYQTSSGTWFNWVGTASDRDVGVRKYEKCIILGDSWCRGYYAGTEHPQYGVGRLVAQKLGISSDKIIDESVSAAGFLTGKTFRAQLNSATTEELDGVDLILVIGGQNDSGSSVSLSAARDEFAQLMVACRSKCPSADIHVFPMPFAYGRTFGSLGGDVTPALDNPKTIMVLRGIHAAYEAATVPIDNMHIHNGAWRWGWALGAGLSESDRVHLTRDGYAKWANIAANLVRNGGDYWPVMSGNAGGYSASGNVQENRVTEINGIVTLKMLINATALNGIGTTFTLPDFCMGGKQRWLTKVCPTSNAVLAIDGSLNAANRVNCSIQFDAVPDGGWIMIDHSWSAGI